MPTPERTIIESLFSIVDKEANDVPFRLNPHQAKVDEKLSTRNIIPKPRQEGISSYILALFAVRCLHKRNTRAVVISHDREATEKLLKRVHYYLDTMRGKRPKLGYSSKNEITFPKTNSSFFIGTQGSREFGRGDTITDLHCSEVAFWDDPKNQVAGLFQAVPTSGTIVLESTGNGTGNYYHRMTMRALEGKSSYQIHFPDWRESKEYSLPVSPREAKYILDNLDEELEEPYYYKNFNLTPSQIKWRRMKLEEMDYDLSLFKQEYPLTVEECFQSSDNSMFHRVLFEVTEEWEVDSEDSCYSGLTSHPRPGLHYVMGADIAAGIGKDNSVIQVLCAETNEQVGEYVTDRQAPNDFARSIAWVGEKFGHPLVVVESNNHGVVTLDNLPAVYPVEKIYRDRQNSDNITHSGFRTTSRTKPIMVGKLRKELAGGMTIHSETLKGELNTFIETKSGRLEAQEGCHDDRVIALALANLGLEKVWTTIEFENVPTYKPKPHYLDFTAVIESLRGSRSQYPVKDQLWFN